MYLTDEELKKHNECCFQIAKHRCETSDLGKRLGIMVSMPTHLNNGMYRGQLALPCGIIKDKKRKINAMQARTGSCVISLAKEHTRYDDIIDPQSKDHTPYAEFSATPDEPGVGSFIAKESEMPVDIENKKVNNVFATGILDLC